MGMPPCFLIRCVIFMLIMLVGCRRRFLVCGAAFVERAVNEKLAGGEEFRLEEMSRGLRQEKLEWWSGRRLLALGGREEEERLRSRSVAVLMEFKRRMNVNSSSIAGWNEQSYPYCKWTGVECDGRGEVVSLILPGMGLGGEITDSLANLTGLRDLNLADNNLQGTLAEGGLPRHLVTLNLANNHLDGTLPESLSQLGRLETLDLSSNRFSGKIPVRLGNCSRLTHLVLTVNNLTDSIPSTLGELRRSLVVLDLSSNQLQGKLPPTLANCTELQRLDVSGNLNIGGGIPLEYGSFGKLQLLQLTANQLSGHLSPSLVSNLTALCELAISCNDFSGPIPSSLGQLLSLQYLELHTNHFFGAIPSSLANCSYLLELDLSSNSLSNSIPSELGSISFSTSDVDAAYYVGYFQAYNNSLSGRIPPSLGNCSGLRLVNLDFNGLTGNIPAELGQLSKLTSLSLTENRLTGSIPRTIGNLSLLEEFDVNFNQLNGNIPEQLTLLASLAKIDLGYNHLQDLIPQRIGIMESLTDLNLAANNLSNVLPSSLANCTQLSTLKVWSNSLTGLIPASLNNLTQLQSLDLHENYFTGFIQNGLDGCGKLYELDLSKNNLSGRIPSDFGNLPQSLRRLSLQWNQLQGPIPDNLGQATNLGYLNLAHNQLTGRIPASVANLRSLILLDLSHNNLTGPIPQGLGASMSLVLSIDLSENDLCSGIPESFLGCLALQTLNLSFNSLNGTIPSSFGKILNLETLDFSHNSLSGQIPFELAHLRELRFLNVSQNQLHGRIPNTGAFSNFTASSFSSNPELCGPPLPVPCSHHSGRLVGSIVAVPIVCVIFGAAVAFSVCCYVKRRYWMSSRTKSNQDSSKERLIMEVHQLRVTPEELHAATDGYSVSNLLGMGASGKVYKGTLRDGKTVAVKRLNLEDNREEAERTFRKECMTLGKIRHRNLVQILSTCCNLEMKALVLPYMENGSLHKHLFGGDVFELDWEKIFNIALNVAHALVYLHYDCDVPIIHCDLKPSNILLDANFVAHVADFGIAKLLSPTSLAASSTSHFRGSIGYIAPECAQFGPHSPKGDIYSYGVVLLCLLTRKQPTSDLFDNGVGLPTWVNKFFPNMFLEAIDPTLRAQVQATAYQEEVLLVLKVALLCTRSNPSDRPTSKEVVEMLSQINRYDEK